VVTGELVCLALYTFGWGTIAVALSRLAVLKLRTP
jgi:hypothetical protein